MLNAYQLQQVAIGKKIRWMSDPYGLAWLAAMGASKDFLVDLAKQAVKCRMPGLAPLDALALLGQERGIFQAPGESAAAFAVRVINAWQAWQLAGGAWGILYQLALRGYTTAYLVYPNGQVWGPSAGVTATNPPAISKGPPWNTSPIDGQAGPVGGPPDPFGRFWNRTLLFFYPVPASWTNIPANELDGPDHGGDLDHLADPATVGGWSLSEDRDRCSHRHERGLGASLLRLASAHLRPADCC